MFQSRAWGNHQPDLTSFTRAAASGCYICEPLLQYALQNSDALEKCMIKQYEYRVYKGKTHTQIIIDMSMVKDRKETHLCRTFEAIPTSELPTDFSIRNRTSAIPLLDTTRSAQRWMDGCLNGHEQCQKNTQPRFYPTRLLELGESTMHIVLTAKEELLGPYAALSYCWGSNPTFLCLTASNISKLQAATPYSKLPIAFQEAICFVKSLSIRYLWIDALCIIQSGLGATEDWRSKCTKMQDVYSNCIVNLSLSRSAHPNASFLGGRTSEATPPFEVETTGLIGEGDSEKHVCAVVSWDYYREALYDQPLGFRAWALQERLFAPRVLSFGCGELFWDCTQSPNASESFPRGLANFAGSFDLTEKAIPDTSDSGILESVWYRLLEEYTDRELTFPETDKLVALSAVATWMGSAMDDVYIAGHFWKTVPYSLNWRVRYPFGSPKRRRRMTRRIVRPAEGETRQRQTQTPSWSWASMDGPLYVGPYSKISLADAEAYTVAPVDKMSPAGQIFSASLIINAYGAEIEWTQEGPNMLRKPRVLDDEVYFLDVNVDDLEDEPTDGARYWIAALIEDDWLGTWEGMLLKELEISGERLYRRKGHFTISFYDSNQWPRRPSWRDNLKLMFGQEKRMFILI